MKTVPGFNPRDFPRRSWQSGDGLYGNSIFWMAVPMFVRRPDGKKKPASPDYLHKWVLQAEKKSRRYMANPLRPAVRALDQGRLRDIAMCEPNTLAPGDAVAVRFTVTYIEGDKDWYPQYLLSDVVRVCQGERPAPRDGGLYVEPAVLEPQNALEEGEIVDGTCRALSLRRR